MIESGVEQRNAAERRPAFIFSTHAFDVEATDYALKVGGTADAPGKFYWVKAGNRSQRIAISEVTRIEACKDHVRIQTRQATVMVRATMASLEKALAGTSVRRVHRSHMVNLQEISEIVSDGNSCTLNLAAGAEIPVGRHCRAQLGTMQDSGQGDDPKQNMCNGNRTPDRARA